MLRNMLKRKSILLLGLFFSLSFAARPFSVEDSSVLEKGFELELGYVKTQGSAVLNYALIPEVVQIGYETAEERAVTLKYNFLPEQTFRVVATEAQASLTYVRDIPLQWATLYTNVEYAENNFFGGIAMRYPMLTNLDLCLEVARTPMIGLVWTIMDIPFDVSYSGDVTSFGLTVEF